jgi:hypothetical protein
VEWGDTIVFIVSQAFLSVDSQSESTSIHLLVISPNLHCLWCLLERWKVSTMLGYTSESEKIEMRRERVVPNDVAQRQENMVRQQSRQKEGYR